MIHAEIRGAFVLMMDSLVLEVFRKDCREASKLDFSNLAGQWVSHEAFNAYLSKLREKTGEFGPSVVGKKIVGKVNEMRPLKADFPTLKDYLTNAHRIYQANNRGTDAGEYKIVEYDEEKGIAVVQDSSPLDEKFELGVFEGALRFYISRNPKSEIVEKKADTGRSIFRYTWRT